MSLGKIGWADLTVNDAETVRDFYRDVVGWTVQPVDMGGAPAARYCVIADPAGAMCALYQPASGA